MTTCYASLGTCRLQWSYRTVTCCLILSFRWVSEPVPIDPRAMEPANGCKVPDTKNQCHSLNSVPQLWKKVINIIGKKGFRLWTQSDKVFDLRVSERKRKACAMHWVDKALKMTLLSPFGQPHGILRLPRKLLSWKKTRLLILLLLGTFAHNFKTICRLVTCDCHGEFKTLTFGVNEKRQSAWIGLHRNVSTNKIKSASTYKHSRLKNGPP